MVKLTIESKTKGKLLRQASLLNEFKASKYFEVIKELEEELLSNIARQILYSKLTERELADLRLLYDGAMLAFKSRDELLEQANRLIKGA